MEYYFDDIISCEPVGEFDNEYVYDIEMDDKSHTFVGNDMLVHNSLYLSYQNLLKSIKGYDAMSNDEKLEIILKLNSDFLNKHNEDYMREYYKTRFADSIQNFELETVAYSGVWMDTKKKYAQILMWKDGKYFDKDNMPMKIKGIEVVKSSTPKLARKQLKEVIRYLLELQARDPWEEMCLLNIKIQELKREFFNADIEDISGSSSVNKYTAYVIDDSGDTIEFKPKCPYNVKALAAYNNIIKKNGFKDEIIYGGKLKWYIVKGKNKDDKSYFAFQSKNLPKWSQQYAPIDKKAMFQMQVLDPFNRIITSIGMRELEIDGNIQTTLFL